MVSQESYEISTRKSPEGVFTIKSPKAYRTKSPEEFPIVKYDLSPEEYHCSSNTDNSRESTKRLGKEKEE